MIDIWNRGNPDCKVCQGVFWVCENHPEKAWGEMIDGKDSATACCCGAGAPCQCNPLSVID